VGGKNGEKLAVGGNWASLPNCPVSRIRTADPAGEYRADNHAWFFPWSNAEGVYFLLFVLWLLGLCGRGTCSFVTLNLLAGMFFLWWATAAVSHLKRDVLVIAMLENIRLSASLVVL
jgi:hypothetical protein